MSKLEGLYLVVSPILPSETLFSATKEALEGGVDLVQFSSEHENSEIRQLAVRLAKLAKEYDKPFLVNNDIALAYEVRADGVHFDKQAVVPAEARKALGENCIVGYTVNADIEKVRWAEKAGADYVSFCAVFQTCPNFQCSIVPLDKISAARDATSLSMFAAGGITLDNVQKVLATGVDGVAITSALLRAENPKQTAMAFKDRILRRHS
jgi:thiamine-phosphate pyrophosphorylase